MHAIMLAGVALIELHAPYGNRVFVNPAEVVSVREPRAGSEAHFAPGARCLLIMANGDLISVREPCDEVRRKLE